ncbi:cytochrome c-type biogenesis protein CcmH [Sinimarinibacterium sp. CAU 1509]|nr:cytochrome c-type biogenesis protein CcmH [Sinimarinibacterium sp. CAU 1509]
MVFALPSMAQSKELEGADLDRYQGMINQLRCLVCQNQTIADSNAPLAQDLREQVRTQIQSGRSDAEIIEYVTARYGDFVLYRPPFKRSTWLLWVGPFALLLGALAIAVSLMRRGRQRREATAVDPDRLRKLLDEESR